VDVRVSRFASQRVFVFGRVAEPGAQVFDSRNTAVSALSRARPARGADPTRILVLTPDGKGGFTQRAAVNLVAIASNAQGGGDVTLQPNDIVHVPGRHESPRVGPSARRVMRTAAAPRQAR